MHGSRAARALRARRDYKLAPREQGSIKSRDQKAIKPDTFLKAREINFITL